jgi:hypothetical protein
VLAVLVAAPMVIFFWQVGSDELYYARLANRIEPGDMVKREQPLDAWRKQTDHIGLQPAAERSAIADQLADGRTDLVKACRKFLYRWPQSPRASEVLWIAAQAESLQVERSAYEQGLIKYTASYPLPASQRSWELCLAEYSDQPHAALARWRLGQLAARDGDIDRATTHLEAAVDRLSQMKFTEADMIVSRSGQVFTPPWKRPAPQYYQSALFEAEKLLWTLRQSNVGGSTPQGQRNARCLAAWLSINPHELTRAELAEKLTGLTATFSRSDLVDNIAVEIALAQPTVFEQIRQLMAIAEAKPPTDASIEASYQLGRITSRTAETAVGLIDNLQRPAWYFQLVLNAPSNPWQRRARRNLQLLGGVILDENGESDEP